MGRVFLSPRLGVKALAARWRRAALAQRHGSRGFFAFDDPLESAAISALVELTRDRGGEEATLIGSGPPNRGGRG